MNTNDAPPYWSNNGILTPDNTYNSSVQVDNKKTKKYAAIRDTLRKQLKENILLIATILAVVIGIGLAFILRTYTNLSDAQRVYFGFPGEIFLRMLKFLILPLISSSLITGIAGLGTSRVGKIAARALIYYFVTTLSAVILGIVLVTTIRPGKRSQLTSSSGDDGPLKGEKISTVDTILDLIR